MATNMWQCRGDYTSRRGLGWWMDLLTTYARDSKLQANYSATAILSNSQITTAPAKSFLAYCLHQPFPGNGFQQCKFFSFTISGPLFTAS
jgi:hypothetical protein